MRNVLILAYECAPYHRPGSTIGAQRPYQFAKHLAKFGWRPIVICCDFNKRWKVSAEESFRFIAEEMPKWVEELKASNSVIIPLPSKQSADRWDKRWLNAVHVNPERGTFVAKEGLGLTIIRKIASFVKLFRGDYSQSWQEAAYHASLTLIKKIPIDFILAEHSPDGGMHVARKLHTQTGIKWAIDFRDPILRFQNKYSLPLVKLIYRNYLKSTEFLISVNKHLAYLDQLDFCKPCFVVTNGYDPEEFRDVLNHENVTDPSQLTLYYGGNITPPYQKLDVLFEVLCLLKEDGKKVNFVYVGNADEAVRKQALEYKIDDRVLCYSHMERNKYIERLRQADIMLLLSFQDGRSRIFKYGLYPGKVFEYFATKKPIVCIPGDGAMLDELLRDTNTGRSFGNATDLSVYLGEMLELKKGKRTIPYFPNPSISDFTRENQTKNLAITMSKALEGRIKETVTVNRVIPVS